MLLLGGNKCLWHGRWQYTRQRYSWWLQQKHIYVYSKRRLNLYQTTINGYNSPIMNGYSRSKMKSCRVHIKIVYTKGRMNGYWIVLIDGYYKPRTKCHGTAKHCCGMGTHFGMINCCKKIFTIGNS
jgi:hypothetical protein